MDGINTVDINRLKKGEVNLGTSIMAVAFPGGVVIGADSRTTTGSYIANRVTDKLTSLHSRAYCCRSGSAADTQAVADIVHYHCQFYRSQFSGAGKPIEAPIRTVASLVNNLIYENKDGLSAGIIVAGWDEEEGGSVYQVVLGGGIFKQKWSIGGSGSTYVYGYCDATFREDFTEEETVEFVRNTLSLAMQRDGSSGGCIRMCVIKEDGVTRHFIPGDKLPTFWQGVEILDTKRAPSGKVIPSQVNVPEDMGEEVMVE